uniref:Uncharacterized protein n=1 Tax=Acrobeloides nanus TaxID=290746 RepID=A0A914D9N7_9BILA
MQGIYSGAGVGLQILGPIFLTQIFSNSGPKYIWIFMLVLTSLCCLLVLIFFPRMISYKKRVQRMQKQEKLIHSLCVESDL